MKRLLILLLPLFLLACPPPVVPDNTVDGGTEPDPVLPPDVDPAEAACARFEELGCKDVEGRNLWEPTPGGVECVEVFRNAEKNGVDLHPACIAKIEKCEDRDACTDKD